MNGRLVLGLESGGAHLSAALVAARSGRGQAASGRPSVAGDPRDVDVIGAVCQARGAKRSDLALPLLSDLLARSGVALGDVSLIAVGRGPGSFTGVRVALSLAQGLSLASGIAVWPVSSLAALALNAALPGLPVLALIDANKGEVFAGLYRLAAGAPPVALLAPFAGTCEAALAAAGEVVAHESMVVLGSGALAYGVASPLPAWAHVATAVATAELALLEWALADYDSRQAPAVDPVYLRKSEAEVMADKRDLQEPTTG